jgi:small-conductance mechanosensitive channel/CRP-like cAMP-binding protein
MQQLAQAPPPATPAPMMVPLQYWIYLAVIAAGALWLAVRGLRSDDRLRQRVGFMTLVLLAVTAIWVATPRLAMLSGSQIIIGVADDIVRLLRVAWWLVLAVLGVLLVERYVWSTLPRRGVPIPRLLPQIVRALILVIAFFGIISALTDQSVAGVLATSGIIAVVMGFALQSTLNDLFSGIALNLERPYRVGDWIQLDSGVIGEVLEINWRSTRLRTKTGNLLVIPNSRVAGAQITNYNFPVPRYRTTVSIVVDVRVPPRRVEALLISAAARARYVLSDPPPIAIVKEYRDIVVLYDVNYWSDNFPRDNEVRNEVLANMWTALDLAGITPGPPMYPDQKPPPRDALPVAQLLRNVDLFQGLDDATRGEIAQSMVRITYDATENVVTAGDAAQSLYVVAEGALEVAIDTQDQGRQVVARLGPGDFFGEMSLLTGEPRSAHVRALLPSVCHVIDKPAIAPILQRNRDCLARLSEVAARRKIANNQTLKSLSAQERASAAEAEGAAILDRVMSFFGFDDARPPRDRAAE